MNKITESNSHYSNLDEMSIQELLLGMNSEDKSVPLAIEKIVPEISSFVEEALVLMKRGGRLFYIGAGTSGRLGIVDASECPPTFGIDHGVVVGIIAGGDAAIRKAVEGAEDDTEAGWNDLLGFNPTNLDIVLGIAASGSTPYVLSGLKKANENGLLTAAITCNPGSPITLEANHSLVAIVGPEFVTGSTRMKSGTAQKLILNMISTSLMIGLGHVKGNKMIDMQLSNAKLVERGALMVAEQTGLDINNARNLLLSKGSVRKAVEAFSREL